MKKTVVALALATAASAAFATNRDPNKDCFESPQYPHGTPACNTTTTAPVTQTTTQNTAVGVKQDTNVGVGVKQDTTVGVGVKTGDTNVGVKTGDTNVGVKTGDTTVKTGDTTVKTGDTTVKTGDTTVKTGDTTLKTGDTTQKVVDNSSNDSRAASNGNQVNITDKSSTVYKQAANRAAPDAAAIVGDGTCKTGTSVSLGVGTVDVTVGGAVASTDWTEGSEKCGKHELKKLEVVTDAARERDLRASENPVDNALAHEQAKASSTAYAKASTALETRVGQMSKDGQPVEIKAGEWQKLAGLNVVVKKPTVVTVTAPAPAPAPVVQQDCSAVIAQFVEYAKAMSTRPAARPAVTPKPAAAAPVAPETSCKAAVDAALKAAGVAPKP